MSKARPQTLNRARLRAIHNEPRRLNNRKSTKGRRRYHQQIGKSSVQHQQPTQNDLKIMKAVMEKGGL